MKVEDTIEVPHYLTNRFGQEKIILFAHSWGTIVPELVIPKYSISGAHDLTVNVNLSRAYLKKLRASVKAFYTFEDSAHSPMFEEPEKFLAVMNEDVLHGFTALADA